ncbi:hypothetical protein BCR37DRAFT_363410 [Protomyces lactucae-debilis]|uniref:ORC6 first cyclin-like domain-containing protein n=1 Tax=Protomyces lactucae-debilis TaxID=2754530 RepID=A0A1Y2FUQ0_PROLT|nr:uncharacterized protein BCR37DRAFT_363410 [Protomyces lactucae-debilis]ORY87731.1 hypothetical protein BCR37DRAFT_363410 [Protomyces lactucae-debilis]
MSKRQAVKQALLKLLPEVQDATLPRELEELTHALDNVQVHLEDNQKAAKLYLCAHIACDQLSHSLGLPDLRLDRPPVPPNRYRKLYEQISRDPQIRNVLSRTSKSTSAQEEREAEQALVREVCEQYGLQVPTNVVQKIMEVSFDIRRGFKMEALVAASYLVSVSVMKKQKINADKKEYDEDAEIDEDDHRAIDSKVRESLARDLSVDEGEITRAYKQLVDTVGDKNWFLALMLGTNLVAGPAKPANATDKRFVLATMVQPMYDFRSTRNMQRQTEWEASMLEQIRKRRQALETVS